ncbi:MULTISPECIES: hypothetical protein [Moorena]|uniref:Uncharacterized protein n=1 Tax=Moorena producens 3L TaxID=489825 RepID=F4XQG5_9CYAN|nr:MULTISPECIES: hypothetical protein [Moorena]EGJ33172.1 hypothetical protein LYNGBM3L_48700 [Moorena producens 3L]NEP67229.1 hypothetical protein [Moorena sp. SIO3A5]OLT56284.1 hypothetical protein BI334_32325 [Moorena producens 3L]
MVQEFTATKKKQGDLICSADWNAAMDEVTRLGKSKLDKESFRGPLTIQESLTVNGTLKLEKGVAVAQFSSTLNGTSNSVPTESAVKTYVDSKLNSLKGSDSLKLTAKSLTVSDALTVNGDLTVSSKGKLSFEKGTTVDGFVTSINPNGKSNSTVVPTEQAVIAYVESKLKELGFLDSQ